LGNAAIKYYRKYSNKYVGLQQKIFGDAPIIIENAANKFWNAAINN